MFSSSRIRRTAALGATLAGLAVTGVAAAPVTSAMAKPTYPHHGWVRTARSSVHSTWSPHQGWVRTAHSVAAPTTSPHQGWSRPDWCPHQGWGRD